MNGIKKIAIIIIVFNTDLEKDVVLFHKSVQKMYNTSKSHSQGKKYKFMIWNGENDNLIIIKLVTSIYFFIGFNI